MRIFYSELRGQKAAENQSPHLKQKNVPVCWFKHCLEIVLNVSMGKGHMQSFNLLR